MTTEKNVYCSRIPEGQPLSGFGLAQVMREGDIMNPDDFEWQHNPHTGRCDKCKARYQKWKALYQAQQGNPT